MQLSASLLLVVCGFLRCSACSSLLGVDKVIQYAITEWLADIRKNQLPGILGGVGPMHSVVQLCKLLLSAPNTSAYLSCIILWLILPLFFILVCLPSPRSEGSVLDAHRAVQEGRTYYSRSPEGGSVLWHIHSICCSGA